MDLVILPFPTFMILCIFVFGTATVHSLSILERWITFVSDAIIAKNAK